ncbi:MAG TPA: hypothetical protein VM599_02870 [Thermoanaerobaculia bacterium]|nr:hypothetical protein [Thermoanaerobaculia bacterium]
MTGALQKWQVSLGYRYQRSDRHFRGTHEEPNRQAEGSEVINTVNLVDLGIRYNFNSRASLSVGIPYFSADRSSALRDADRNIVGRTAVQAQELGDIAVVGRYLLWDPAAQPRGNLQLGLGIKAPTGEYDVEDTRVRLDENGQRVESVRTVDQSIQPGDGGWGVLVDMSGFRALGATGEYALYASGAYLINPEGTNGTPTFRSRESEAIMSIADQYLFRTGALAAPASWKGFGLGLGGRIEGVPPHDLFGSSEGFRRPGYAVSVEPSISWTSGVHSLSLSVPIAVQRNRQRSTSDILVDGHGDAAFADYVVLMGYWHRF